MEGTHHAIFSLFPSMLCSSLEWFILCPSKRRSSANALHCTQSLLFIPQPINPIHFFGICHTLGRSNEHISTLNAKHELIDQSLWMFLVVAGWVFFLYYVFPGGNTLFISHFSNTILLVWFGIYLMCYTLMNFHYPCPFQVINNA